MPELPNDYLMITCLKFSVHGYKQHALVLMVTVMQGFWTILPLSLAPEYTSLVR
ncbi:hypothetical protein [Nostoc sp. T09]|uniref:hypothetical protein n=1 Tax=Nostoc sp. T09 TaxID=1932621 RepID=UPI0015C4FE62|nr:hypothetical protein [Nostoc sp. T09]